MAITILVGVVVVFCTVYGVWQFEATGCEQPYTNSAWIWDYSVHLRTHPH